MGKKGYFGISKNIVNADNPVSAGKTSGNYTIADKKVTINYTTTGDAYFWLNLTQPLIANKIYILSFDCECEDDGINVTWAVYNRLFNMFTFKNGRVVVPFYVEADVSTQLLVDDTDDAEEVQQKWIGKNIVISNFQIEDPEALGVARGAERAYLGVAENLINTNTAFSIINNGNISVRDKQTIVLNYAVAKDTYFFIPLTQTLVTGKSYTVSFDCSGIDDSMVLTILIDNQASNPMRLENGRLSRSFTPHRDVVGRLLMDDTSPWTNVIGKEIVLSNFLIEEDGASGVARRVTKAYIGDENGIARLWYERNYAFIPSDASEFVTADGKTFCVRGDLDG